MPYHLRQSRRVEADAGIEVEANDEIIFGGRGRGGLPVAVADPPTFGLMFRSRPLIGGRYSNQILRTHLKKRQFMGTVEVSKETQYDALILLTQMSERRERLSLVYTSPADPSRVLSFGEWFVETLLPKMHFGVGGEPVAISYKLMLVEAGV